MTSLPFIKAHGTENDFVVLVDPDVHIELSEERVRFLCDRRAGVGGDGVIRVATAGALQHKGVLEALPEGVEPEDWFMDYRNADGSLAEMCGNGVRVFAHVLATVGVEEKPVETNWTVGTRAGRKTVRIHSANDFDAEVSVGMGTPVVDGVSTAKVGDQQVAGLAINVGNPHLACVLPQLDESQLQDFPLAGSVECDEAFFPQGVNLEIVTPLTSTGGTEDSAGRVSMRVHERGVGETRSCGTGTVAAAVAALADAGIETGSVEVNVPGGKVEVTVTDDGATLRGPSRIVARGDVTVSPN